MSLPHNFGPGSWVRWLLLGGVRVKSALWLSLNGSLFLCTLRVHRLGVGIGSRGSGGVLRWFTLVSAHPLDLLFQASLSLFEVVVLVLERGGRSDERCDQVLGLFDFICEDFDGVEDSVVGCHGCLGVELVLEDGAAFTKVSEGRA